jgi:hypothetical protein
MLLLDSQYFGTIGYYKLGGGSTHCTIDASVPYHKQSFANRMRVCGANGIMMLSIPLAKGRLQKGAVKDLRIDYSESWQKVHLRTLASAYNRSPWFDHFVEDLQNRYSKRMEFLLDWNMSCLEMVVKFLRLQTVFIVSHTYARLPTIDGLQDYRRAFRTNQTAAGMPDIRYRQVFEDRLGFIPGLSILDLLFCEGKRSREILFDSNVDMPALEG